MDSTAIRQTLELLPLPYLCADTSFHILWRNSCLQKKIPYLNMMRSMEPLLLGQDCSELLQKLSKKREAITITCRLPLISLTLSLSPLSFDEEGNLQEILVAFTEPATELGSDHALASFNETLCQPMEGLFATIAYLRHQLENSYDKELLKMIQSCYQMLRSCMYIGEYSDLIGDYKALDIRHHDISSYFLRTLEPIIEPLQRRGIEISYDLPTCTILVPFDEAKMNTVLFSLICNSCAFCDYDNQIHIAVNIDETSCHITVSDHGYGIPREILPKVMDPYFSRGLDSESRPGLGLGLALCKTIIERHQGTIELQSIQDRGLTVNITLPLYSDLPVVDKKTLRSSKVDYVSERYPLHSVYLSTVLPPEELQ